MRSHSVTYHQTEVWIPPLPPAEAGTRFSDPGCMQGWVEPCYVKADQLGIEPATCQSQVQRPTAAPTRNNNKKVFDCWTGIHDMDLVISWVGLGWVGLWLIFYSSGVVWFWIFVQKLTQESYKIFLHIFFALLQQNLMTILMVLCSFPRVTSCRFNTKALLIPTATAWVGSGQNNLDTKWVESGIWYVGSCLVVKSWPTTISVMTINVNKTQMSQDQRQGLTSQVMTTHRLVVT